MNRRRLYSEMFGVLMALCLNGTSLAMADQLQPPTAIPADMAVPDGNRLFLIVHAVGTQNYTCTGSGTWGAAVPQADLFDDDGRLIGTHFAGPTWQLKDGSSVVGSKIVVHNVDGAIPWLLLKEVSTTVGPDGDRLSSTTYIQRILTTAGTAPATPCSPGATASVPYTAYYLFYRSSTGN